MAHHGQDPDSKMSKLFEELTAAREDHQLGATGNFPQGRIADDDEGEIRLGVAAANGHVILNFGTPVAWIGFDASQAREIAQLLLDNARDCDGVEARVRVVSS